MTLQPGDEADLLVEKPAAGGEMLARFDGQIVLVGGAIPGERVRVRVGRVAKRVAHAVATEIVEPSPDRRDPFPDPFCGGCVYSHIQYSRQLAIKSEIITDAFARIGKIALPDRATVTPSPEEGYRMRARLHVRGSRAGFFREGTHQICDARQTRQLLPSTCDAIDRVVAAARSLGAADELREVEVSENVAATERVAEFAAATPMARRVVRALMEAGEFLDGPHVTDVLTMDGRDVVLRRHVRSFFQGNRHMLRDLLGHVVSQLPRGCTVTDLYAGAGLFALGAAVVRDATVTAVEGDRYAAEDLRANAAAIGDRVRTHRASVEEFVGRMEPADAIIVDPPRIGMTSDALEGVLRAKPPILIYVSCDVATLARDARAVVATGYSIESARAFDLFPNTPHVETVVVFRR